MRLTIGLVATGAVGVALVLGTFSFEGKPAKQTLSSGSGDKAHSTILPPLPRTLSRFDLSGIRFLPYRRGQSVDRRPVLVWIHAPRDLVRAVLDALPERGSTSRHGSYDFNNYNTGENWSVWQGVLKQDPYYKNVKPVPGTELAWCTLRYVPPANEAASDSGEARVSRGMPASKLARDTHCQNLLYAPRTTPEPSSGRAVQ